MADEKDRDTKIDAAADDLAELSNQQILAKVDARRNVKMSADEAAKTHPLVGFSLGEKDWQALREHILDGGGVTDDRALATTLLQSLMHDDQQSFWPGLIHLLKSRAKITGNLRALPFGGVSLSGIAPGGGGTFGGVGPG